MIRFILLPFALCLLPSLALAQPRPVTPREPAAPDAKYSLTVYSSADPASFDPQPYLDDPASVARAQFPGFAVVRETRRLTLDPGESTVRFTDVPASIDPTTVSFKSLTAPDSTTVLEQSFEYDAATPDKLLEKYLGKNIIVNRKQEPLAGERTRTPDTIEARLLSFTPEQFVLETNNKQLPVQIIPRNTDITEIKLFDLRGGLYTRPTLVWRLNTTRAGDHDVAVSYQAEHLTWRADYTLTVDKTQTAADLSAWVTVVNLSGAPFPSARLKLIAGDLNRARQERTVQRAYVVKLPAERALGDYHAYTFPKPVTLPAGAARQLELFAPKSHLQPTRTYIYQGQTDVPTQYPDQPPLGRDRDTPVNHKVDTYLKLANTEKTGLGLPLPAGRVRVYQRDDEDAEFIGEDTIDHTPANEQLAIRLGSAFDLVGDRRQTNLTEDPDKRSITETIEIKLRNQKKDPAEIVVKETLHRWPQWQIVESTEKYEKRNARTIHFNVAVPPGQEKTITYAVKYSW